MFLNTDTNYFQDLFHLLDDVNKIKFCQFNPTQNSFFLCQTGKKLTSTVREASVSRHNGGPIRPLPPSVPQYDTAVMVSGGPQLVPHDVGKLHI